MQSAHVHKLRQEAHPDCTPAKRLSRTWGNLSGCFLILFAFCCSPYQEKTNKETVLSKNLENTGKINLLRKSDTLVASSVAKVESFKTFSSLFFSDSNFQKSRIIFPLPKYEDTGKDLSSVEKWKFMDKRFTCWCVDTCVDKARPGEITNITYTDTSYKEKGGFINSEYIYTVDFRRRGGKWYLVDCYLSYTLKW